LGSHQPERFPRAQRGRRNSHTASHFADAKQPRSMARR
jgi:hypothetical protein